MQSRQDDDDDDDDDERTCWFLERDEERRVVEGQSKNGFFPVEERDKVDVFIFFVGVYVVVVVRKKEKR